MLGGDFQGVDGRTHWINFPKENSIIDEDGSFYVTLNIDLELDTVSLYSFGSKVGTNICEKGYLDQDLICDSTIPFTIGMELAGNPCEVRYGEFSLYGCRLYNKVLSDEEIKLNYNESKSLLEN